jgi:regulator of sigma E protease
VQVWEDVYDELRAAPGGPVQLRFRDAAPVTLNVPAADRPRGQLLSQLLPWRPPVIGEVMAGLPAARAGIKPGDRVTHAGGRPVQSWDQRGSIIHTQGGRPLPLVVERDGKAVALTVTPAASPDTNALGERVTVGKIGAVPGSLPTSHRPAGVGTAVKIGATSTWNASALIVTILKKLFTGEISPRNMGGLLSIGEASGQTARQGLEVWLTFLALFSVNLAVLNLLPIPILDGGHLMFLAFEAVRGRPLSVEARIRLSQVGLVIVVALMIWANGNDVVRLIFKR